MRDLHNNILPKVAFNTVAITSDTTTNGVEIDLQGYEGCEFVIMTGSLTDGDYTPLIQESDTSGSYSGSVDDSDLLGTEAEAAFTDNTDDNKVARIGYIGNKRYVRLSIVSTGTTSGATVGAIVLLGKAYDMPVAGNSQ